MTIRVRTILVIVSINLMIILFSILLATGYVRDNIEKYIEADMLVVADMADQFVSSELELLRREANEAAEGLAAADRTEWAETLPEQAQQHMKFIGMSIMNKTGEIAATTGSNPAPAAVFNDKNIQKAFEGEQAFTSTIKIESEVKFYLATPIPGMEDFILVATLDGMYFSDLTSKYYVWDTGHIFIDDNNGYVIANSRPEWVQDRQNFILQAQTEPQYTEIASAVKRLISGERGIAYYSVDGVSRICAFRPISGSAEGWALGIVAPLTESPVRNVEQGLAIIAVVSFLLSVAAAVIASNFIKKPFEEVAELKEKAEEGLIEQQKMTAEIELRDNLLQTVNEAIDILLRSDPDEFADTLHECMGMMAQAINADRMYLHKNHIEDGRRYNVRLHEWSRAVQQTQDSRASVFLCEGQTFLISDRLIRGESIHSLSSDLPALCKDCLAVGSALAVMVTPIFLRDEFWGFVGFDNCHSEQLFTETEESIMRSGSLLIASALLRNEYMLGLRDTSTKLETALVEAEEANNAKSNFLARMSHEIRTPLNAVIGLSELTLGEPALSNTVENNLEKIYGAGATILSIVNDILDIAKTESGKLEIYPVQYDTPSLVNDIVTLNTIRIGEKPITFKLTVDENLPGTLFGDDLRIKQIFTNLLSNAFKYTDSGIVEWRLSAERDGDDIWLVSSVRDTGIGIRPEDAHILFSDYNQVKTASTRNIQGTGLGLSITKRLVEMMDGTISFESEYGKGTTFHVRLRQGVVSDVPIGKEVSENLSTLNYALSKRDAVTKLSRLDLSYAHVLVVDDVPINIDVVRGMLKPYGVKVSSALSAPQAIEMIRTGNPRFSAIFMDHMMPGMDGIEATWIIRNEIDTDYARHVPIIALTANAIIGNEEMFLSNGFQAFISKPIDRMKLDVVLRHWVRDRALEAQLPTYSPDSDTYESDSFTAADVATPDIDLQKALERFGGDESVVIDVLRSYAVNTRPLLESLQRYLDEENLTDYAIVVHGIKGSSYGIFAQVVGKTAEELELAAKAGDLDSVMVNHPPFVEMVESVLSKIDGALNQFYAGILKPVAAEPDPKVLAELRQAAEAFNMDKVDQAMEKLESFRYDSGEELITWLRKRVDHMAFEEISGGEWLTD